MDGRQIVGECITGEELAALAGVSLKTLSRYTKAGLLPSPVRTGAGNKTGNRNYYPADTYEKLRDIQLMREEGRTLEQITANLMPGPKHKRTDIKLGSMEPNERKTSIYSSVFAGSKQLPGHYGGRS